MSRETYSVRGMHCASCVAIIEKTLKKVEGVRSITVNYGTEKAIIDFEETKTNVTALSQQIEPLGYSFILNDTSSSRQENAKKKDALKEIAGMKEKLFSAIPLAILSALIMGWDILTEFKLIAPSSETLKEFFHHLLPIMATYVLFVVGKPYLIGLYRFFRFGRANMDTLIGLGTVAAYGYSFILTAFEASLRPYVNVEQTYYDVTIVVITFIALGKYLEALSKLKTGDALEQLLHLQAKTALVIRDGKEQEVPIDQVMHGDRIIVKPGQTIPVDGTLIEGASFIDESLLSGESMPVEKNIGDTVAAGTLNTTGSFTFQATKIGSETFLARIIALVETAQGSKAPVQKLVDSISGVFVPIILLFSFLTLLAWLVFGTQTLGFPSALSFGLTAFVGILVIACPCALGLATPMAIIVGVGKGAREGILIKDAATLEKLQKVRVIALDKTGTITKGKPEVVSVRMISSLEEYDALSLLASLENKSEHPLSAAIMAYAKQKKVALKNVSNFEIIKGKGVKGTIDGVDTYAGNSRLLSDLGLSFDDSSLQEETRAGRTPLILATREAVLAVVMVADALKPEVKKEIETLLSWGIRIVMLSGDNKHTAEKIAKDVGIQEVIAEVLPDEKLKKIQELQKDGYSVAMVGDGVNDAPALAQADVGIAMATGTDAAIETAGITLLHGDMTKLVKAIKLSRLTLRGIRQNLFWAFAYNIIGIPIAAGILYPFFGWMLSPVFAGLAMAFSSVSVVSNSLRIKAKTL